MDIEEIEKRVSKLEEENKKLKTIIENRLSEVGEVKKSNNTDLSRRDFLKKLGIGAVGLGALTTPVASQLKITKNSIIGANNDNLLTLNQSKTNIPELVADKIKAKNELRVPNSKNTNSDNQIWVESGKLKTKINGTTKTLAKTSTAPNSGISRWKFEQDVTDSWDGNDGTDNTSAGFTSIATVGNYAKSFDAADNDVVKVSDDTSLNFGSSESFSVSMWVKIDDLSSDRTLLEKRTGSGNNFTGYQLKAESTNSNFQFISDDGGSTGKASGGSAITGTFIHLVGVTDHSNSEVRLYVDGSLTDTVAQSLGQISNSVDLHIGAYQNVSAEYHVGDIDDSRIYSKALSDSEVSNLYNTGSISG